MRSAVISFAYYTSTLLCGVSTAAAQAGTCVTFQDFQPFHDTHVRTHALPSHQCSKCPSSFRLTHGQASHNITWRHVYSGLLRSPVLQDGDYKQLKVIASNFTIKPFNNSESWIISGGPFDENCSSMIDFNVPGKPNPPPIKLRMTYAWVTPYSTNPKHPKADNPVLIFTDPSGKLAAPTLPLNIWYGLIGETPYSPYPPSPS